MHTTTLLKICDLATVTDLWLFFLLVFSTAAFPLVFNPLKHFRPSRVSDFDKKSTGQGFMLLSCCDTWTQSHLRAHYRLHFNLYKRKLWPGKSHSSYLLIKLSWIQLVLVDLLKVTGYFCSLCLSVGRVSGPTAMLLDSTEPGPASMLGPTWSASCLNWNASNIFSKINSTSVSKRRPFMVP